MLKRLRPLDSVDGYYEGRNNNWDDCNREAPPVKQQRTNSNPFLLFCDLILKYEKYTPIKEDENGSVYSSDSLERTQSFSTESNSSFASSNGSGDRPNEAEADDESWDLITCHCMKPFAGRPMIECTECQTWVHMSCAKVRRNNIPDDFVCQVCREAKSSTRRSERIRGDEPRRVPSTS